MRKLFLIGLVVFLMTSCKSTAQIPMRAQTQTLNKLERGRTLREIDDFHQFTVGKANKIYSFTDRKDYYLNNNLDWKAEYQSELTIRENDSIVATEGVKISYADSLFYKMYDLKTTGEKLEVEIHNGKQFVYLYEKGVDKKKQAQGKILVSKSFYDLHHHMWRLNVTDADFTSPQLETDVVVTSGLSKKAINISGILKYYETDKHWDPVRIETDNINYAFVFTLSEGRAAIVVFYMEGGKLKEEKVVPRPQAEFSNFSFTTQGKDVCQMDVVKGRVDIKIYPSINGTNLTKNPRFAIRWQADFKGPGEDTWTREGKVDL